MMGQATPTWTDGQVAKEHEESERCWCAPEVRVYAEATIIVHHVLVTGEWHDKARAALIEIRDG